MSFCSLQQLSFPVGLSPSRQLELQLLAGAQNHSDCRAFIQLLLIADFLWHPRDYFLKSLPGTGLCLLLLPVLLHSNTMLAYFLFSWISHRHLALPTHQEKQLRQDYRSWKNNHCCISGFPGLLLRQIPSQPQSLSLICPSGMCSESSGGTSAKRISLDVILHWCFSVWVLTPLASCMKQAVRQNFVDWWIGQALAILGQSSYILWRQSV